MKQKQGFLHLRRAWRLLKMTKDYDYKLIWFMVVVIIFGTLTPLLGGFLPSWIIAVLTAGYSQREMVVIILAMFGVYALIAAGDAYFSRRHRAKFSPFRVMVLYRKLMLACVQCDYQLYEKKEIQSLVRKATKALSGSFLGSIGAFYRDLVTIMISFLSLLIYSFLLADVNTWIVLLVFVLSGIHYTVYRICYKRFYKAREEYRDHQMHIQYFEELAFDASLGKDIRLYQSHPLLKAAFRKINQKGRGIIKKQEYSNMAHSIAGEILSCIRDGICYGVLISMMIRQQMTIADFVFYLAAVTGLSERFFRFIEVAARMHTNLTYVSDYFEALEHLHPVQGQQDPSQAPLDIVFDHVEFTYPDSERKVLDDFCLHIHAGEKVALVGMNGAGKTTLVKLLCGMYHPAKGRILINGKDLSTLDPGLYHQRVTAVFQDAVSFSFTIGENISGKVEGEYNSKQVKEVLRQVGLLEKIEALPEGVHTYLGKEIHENGIQLSGGESQRMFLARALYKNPKFIILDEPTSAMDALNEQKLYEQYNELIKDRGALFISHRLASTRFCDRILYMKDGVIQEEGSHEELMHRQGAYYEMFTVQSRYYKEEGAEKSETDTVF